LPWFSRGLSRTFAGRYSSVLSRPPLLSISPMRTFRAVLPLAGILALSACIEGVKPAREKTGFISANTFDAGGGSYAMRITGAFYRYDGLTTGLRPPETCEGLPFSTVPPTVATFPTVGAGPYLFTSVGGRRDTLYESSGLGITVYQLLTVPGIPFTPGDSLRLEIPGDVQGFPGTTLNVRTSEAFTFEPVGDPTDNQPLTITWTPPPMAGSLMAFSLRFSSGTSDVPDVQIFCMFNDDGSGQVPANLAAIWKASSPATRRVRATRIRQTEHVFDARTKVTLLSYFEQPLDPLPGL
jgi:hypothetical protein